MVSGEKSRNHNARGTTACVRSNGVRNQISRAPRESLVLSGKCYIALIWHLNRAAPSLVVHRRPLITRERFRLLLAPSRADGARTVLVFVRSKNKQNGLAQPTTERSLVAQSTSNFRSRFSKDRAGLFWLVVSDEVVV